MFHFVAGLKSYASPGASECERRNPSFLAGGARWLCYGRGGELGLSLRFRVQDLGYTGMNGVFGAGV